MRYRYIYSKTEAIQFRRLQRIDNDDDPVEVYYYRQLTVPDENRRNSSRMYNKMTLNELQRLTDQVQPDTVCQVQKNYKFQNFPKSRIYVLELSLVSSYICLYFSSIYSKFQVISFKNVVFKVIPIIHLCGSIHFVYLLTKKSYLISNE